MKTRLMIVLACTSLLLSSLGFAQTARYVDGTHFRELAIPAPTSTGKIEVLEVFWYGCPHCYSFEPLVNNWADAAPDDVEFLRLPAVFNNLQKAHAQLYYTCDALGILDKIHGPIFDTMINQRINLQSQERIGEFLSQYGVDDDDFKRAFNSFSVRSKVNQAEKRTADYRPKGTPSMVVNGRYVISIGGAVDSQREMLRIVDFLVNKERASKS